MDLFKRILVKIGNLSLIFWPAFFSRYFEIIFNYIYTGRHKRNFKFFGSNTCICYTAKIVGASFIEIGKDSYFDKGCSLTAFCKETDNHKTIIKIGDNCVFGSTNHITACNYIIIGNGLRSGKDVLLSDNSHGNPKKMDDRNIHPDKRPLYSGGGIVIGDNVWIGEKVSILSGVTIGNGAIIGANSVVTHDIPANSTAVGIPAKILK